MKTVLWNSLLVGSGGFIGAVLRYGLSGMVHRLLPRATFPFGTLTVNLLGGFTTYSTFGYETFAMLRDGEALRTSSGSRILSS